jgi:glycerate kinase
LREILNFDNVVLKDPEFLSKIDSVVVPCDVRSPLLGPRGAAAVFGPQKGAIEQDIK